MQQHPGSSPDRLLGKCPGQPFQTLLIPLIIHATLLSRLPYVALFAALLLLAWALAYWTWVFLAPRQAGQAHAVSAPVLSKLLAEQAVAFHLFGGAAPGAREQGPAAAPSNIGVRGIYAARDGRSGFAVLVLDGHPVAALLGKAFAPGMVLQGVYADRVEIQRNGQIETARLAPVAVFVPGMDRPVAASSEPSALRVVVHELGPGQFGFSRTQMLEALKRADQLPLLGRFGPHPRGGAVLEQSPAGGLPEKLGLKVGDVVTGINEKSLAGPRDVMRLYQQLVESEKVSVDVLRAGEKMNLGIQVAP